MKKIYKSFADRYDALVSREDYKNNLLPAILSIDPLAGKDVIELGAGTGRITYQIVPLARHLVVSDISHHMLLFAKRGLSALALDNWYLSIESHVQLPFADDIAEVVLAGWSFCYAALDGDNDWEITLNTALGQVGRVLSPGGTLILIESLGTGYEEPQPPEVLKDYLAFLDGDHFESTWIRTDYLFTDIAEAKDLTTFFFGEAKMPMIEIEAGVVVPECTGLWWKKY